MKLIKTEDAVGHVLCHDITQIIKGVTKDAVFRKGHIITEKDIPVLLSAGKDNIYVWEKDENMLHEDEAAEILRSICQNENMHATAPKEGKIELIADIDGLLLVDLERLRAINSLGDMMIAAWHSGFMVKKGDKLCGTRVIPLVIAKERMEQAKKRLATLDVVMSRLYEDYALGEISKEKYKKMTADYEAEQERLKLEIETTEEWVEQRQAMGDDLDAFIALTKKYVDVTELTQTIVNEYIKKIIIHAPDKSGGKRRQKVEIFFNFVDDVEIPVLAEPMIAESTLGRRKTA